MEIINLKELSREILVSEEVLIECLTIKEAEETNKLIAFIDGGYHVQEELYHEIVKMFKESERMIINVDKARIHAKETLPIEKANYIYYLFNNDSLVYIGQQYRC